MGELCECIGFMYLVYISFDIDGIDLLFVGGIGMFEIGGFMVLQVLEVICGCCGFNVVGGDLVEVVLFYDFSGNIVLLGVNLLYEMLCVLFGVFYC